MGTSIATNVNSLNTQQSFRVNSEFQAGVIQRLTSGYRITRAADDPTGLALANRYRADSGELSQGIKNLNDGISRLQIIDGGTSNISNILDRLKTLATQSSADTFSGDRNTLNTEFQTLLGEIDRQAESIGLNTWGEFAQPLTVFVGGSGSSSDTKVSIDLSASAVDSRGLGLGGATGMEAVAANANIGPSSPDHTVAQIVKDANNTSATAGCTDFYISGPGFSDSGEVKVSVNLQGVTTLDGLVAAVNSAIQVAASGTTPAAAALQKAGIVASSYYGYGLAFSSTDTPFQVEAGDRMANALMGNLKGTSGVDIATTVSGVNTAAAGDPFVAPTNVTVRITGGSLAGPVDITLDPAYPTTTAAIGDLTAKVNGNAQLQAAGISVSGAAGGALTFTDARGEIFSVQAAGDTADALGLGSFVASGSGVDYTSIQGTAYDNTVATGNAHLEFSIDGGVAVPVDIDLSGGDPMATQSISGAELQKTLNDAFASTPALQAAGLVATFSGNSLAISSGNHTYFRVNAGTSDPFADIGFGTGGQAFTSSLAVPTAKNKTIDSSGGTTVTALSFSDLSYGTDGQTITVSADDPTGVQQTATIALGNNAQGRNGRSIDETIAAINQQLQQSGGTLQQVTAVKENAGGAERIGFLSSLGSFRVAASNSVNGSGLNGGAAISEASYAIAPLVNVSVTTRDSALLALTAINGAVSALGATQAVVGKAENQLNYAINLSQSEVTNLSSAESRIRDTDMAADAANLTKAQIQAQASVAAMAQANSAAQAVLALLKG
jgi:flagellin